MINFIMIFLLGFLGLITGSILPKGSDISGLIIVVSFAIIFILILVFCCNWYSIVTDQIQDWNKLRTTDKKKYTIVREFEKYKEEMRDVLWS